MMRWPNCAVPGVAVWVCCGKDDNGDHGYRACVIGPPQRRWHMATGSMEPRRGPGSGMSQSCSMPGPWHSHFGRQQDHSPVRGSQLTILFFRLLSVAPGAHLLFSFYLAGRLIFFVCASSFNLIWTRTDWVSAAPRDDAQLRPARTMETFVQQPRAVPRSAHRPSSSRINRAPLGPPQLFVPRLPPSTSTPLSPQLIDTQSQQCLTPPRTSTTP